MKELIDGIAGQYVSVAEAGHGAAERPDRLTADAGGLTVGRRHRSGVIARFTSRRRGRP